MLPDSEVVLEATGLERRFREGSLDVRVLSNLNFVLSAADQVAIVGSSGSGKSTLLHLLGGLDLPTSGSVKVMGRDWQRLSDAQRGVWRNRHVGFVYQFHHLLPEFTAQENVAMPLLIRGLTTRKAMAEAQQMLKWVELAERAEHKPSELSGGERQRVAIARALVTRPSILLADEPTGNLDRERAERVFALLQDLNTETGAALVLVTHDLTLATRMQRILRLRDGTLEAHANTSDG